MIEYINYKNEKYPVRISYLAIMGLKKDTGKGLEDIMGMDEKIIESLLFHSLRSGAKAEGNEMPFKKTDIVDILEECFMEFVVIIPKFFPESDVKSVKKPSPNRQQRRKAAPKKK